MADQITQLAAQCDARFYDKGGVAFDGAAWARFVQVLSLMLPISTHHERLWESTCGGVDLFYETPPTIETYAYLASFCQFQENYRREPRRDSPSSGA